GVDPLRGSTDRWTEREGLPCPPAPPPDRLPGPPRIAESRDDDRRLGGGPAQVPWPGRRPADDPKPRRRDARAGRPPTRDAVHGQVRVRSARRPEGAG